MTKFQRFVRLFHSDTFNDLLFDDHSSKTFEYQAIDLLKDIRLFLFLIFIFGVLF